jgi:replication-associated recombination protein RarA
VSIKPGQVHANSRPTKEGAQYGKARLIHPPLIVFVDEVHLVARAVQESFLTVLESRDRTVVLDDRVAVLAQATYLFATTRSSELDAAFRSRCTEVYLHAYTEAEVAQMLARAFAGLSFVERRPTKPQLSG